MWLCHWSDLLLLFTNTLYSKEKSNASMSFHPCSLSWSHYACILNVRKRSQCDRSNPTLAKERLRQVFVRRFAWTKAFCVCDKFAWLKCEITLIRYRNNRADTFAENTQWKMCTDFNVILLISYSFIITILPLIIPLFSTFDFVFLWGMQYPHAN